MTYNPNIHHRRSIRLKGYDYSQAGMYFITICVQNRLNLFGEIVDETVGATLVVAQNEMVTQNEINDDVRATLVVAQNEINDDVGQPVWLPKI